MEDVVDSATHLDSPTQTNATADSPRSSNGSSSRGRANHVVHVSTYPLHPRRTGGQLRGWHLAEAMTRSGATDVTVISLTTDPSLAGDYTFSNGFRERSILLDPKHEKREARLRLVTGDISITDVAVGLMWPGIDSLSTVLTEELTDAAAAVLVQPYLVNPVREIAPHIAMVCDAHNDEYGLKSAIMPTSAGGKWLLSQIEHIERRAVNESQLVTATTDLDVEAITSRYGGTHQVAVVPNGVDTSTLEFVTGEERSARRHQVAAALELSEQRPRALFIGSGHQPNIDAGRFIVEMASTLSHIDFVFAGRHADLLHHTPQPRNVYLLGPVGDDMLTLLLGGCDLALNPMAVGSGSNLKLLTYLAAGLPVVSSDIGVRGIDAEDAGIEAVELSDFENSIERVIAESGDDRAISGRHYVERHCDWRTIGGRFATLTEDVIAT